MGGIPPQPALWAVCITPRLMELWATLFAGCGKAAFAFPYAVNETVSIPQLSWGNNRCKWRGTEDQKITPVV